MNFSGQQDSVTSVTKEPSTNVTNVTPPKKTNRSISQSDLLDHQVHIEIKNMSKSTEVLNSKTRPLNRRSSLAVTPSVSVVNLKHSSADNLPQMSSKRFISPNNSKNFGQPKSQMVRPNALLPGRMVMGIKVIFFSKVHFFVV